MNDIIISDSMLTTTKRGKTVGVIYYRDLQGNSRTVSYTHLTLPTKA